MRTVRASRGYVLLAKFWMAWAMLILASIWAQLLFIAPSGSLLHLAVVLLLTLYLASVVAAARTRLEVSPTELICQGRLRRRRVDLSGVQRLEVVPSVDWWSFLVFLLLIGTSIWTIALVRTDGSKEDLSPIIGSHRGCSDAVREACRLMGRKFASESEAR